ncbi:MAG TPA: hypothetical protein VKA46_35475 [Gemmataceae bacterium]|nr:hypothetical protein [Gemmataceae bacterium]
MIWFACARCGKRHKQPADAAGSLVFCECGQANRVPWDSTAPAPRESREGEARPGRRRRREAPPRDPAYCLDHEEAPSAHTCPDCGEAFCPRCLVEFQGLRLCGPCKNFRVRKLQRLPRVAGMAIAALVVGLLSAPIVFCTTVIPMVQHQQPGVILGYGVVGMAIGAAALLLGLVGLRVAEKDAGRGGRGLAMTGAAFGTAGLLWSLSLVVTMASRFVQG